MTYKQSIIVRIIYQPNIERLIKNRLNVIVKILILNVFLIQKINFI